MFFRILDKPTVHQHLAIQQLFESANVELVNISLGGYDYWWK